MKLRCLIKSGFISAILIYFTLLSGEDACLQQARYFSLKGNAEFALTEYKRYLYFNPLPENEGEIYYEIAMLYRNRQNWDKALLYLNKSARYADKDLKEQRKIDKAVIYLAKADYTMAEFELLRLVNFSSSEEAVKRGKLLLAVTWLYTSRFSEAAELINEILADNKQKQAEIATLFAREKEIKYKSPELAKWLSIFLPGAGQIYAGDYKDGINAFALNSFTTYLIISAAIDGHWGDILISHITLFERYYRGNRYNARSKAEQFNKLKEGKIAAEIIKKLNSAR